MSRLLRWLLCYLWDSWQCLTYAGDPQTRNRVENAPQAGKDTDPEFDGNETIHTSVHTAAPGMTHLTPALVGCEQRADGSWWLVLATLNGAGLPDGEQITPQQAARIGLLLRQVRMDGGL